MKPIRRQSALSARRKKVRSLESDRVLYYVAAYALPTVIFCLTFAAALQTDWILPAAFKALATVGVYLTVCAPVCLFYRYRARVIASEFPLEGEEVDLAELLFAYRISETDREREVSDALIKKMESYSPMDRPNLSRYETSHLTHAILNGYLDLSFTALRFLAAFGDSDHLPLLRRIAKGVGSRPTPPSLRELASNCAEALERRLKGQSYEQVLLRSSEEPFQSDALLRASSASNSSEEQAMLLRSSAND